MTAEEFAAHVDVSRETMARLEKYDALLLDWSDRHNLVARSTLATRWRRHYLDSAQLYALLPEGARALVDLGSGAGFPGLVLAAMGSAHGLSVTLIESVGKKAAFLRAAAEAMDLGAVRVIPERIEAAKIDAPDVITARALSRTGKLCQYAHKIAGRNTTFLFPKGEKAEEELTEALKSWRMEVARHPSVTDDNATIFEFKNLVPRLVPRSVP